MVADKEVDCQLIDDAHEEEEVVEETTAVGGSLTVNTWC